VENPRAQEAVAERYAVCCGRLVAVVAVAAGSRGETEECVQEAFVRLLHHWGKASQYEDPEAWARAVAFRLLSDRRRKTRNGLRALLRSQRSTPTPGPTGDRVEVMRALAHLPLASVRWSCFTTSVDSRSGRSPPPKHLAGHREVRHVPQVNDGEPIHDTTGVLQIVGDPSGQPPRTVAGIVTFTAADGSHSTVPVEGNGAFEVVISPGTYVVTGTSPSCGGGADPCKAERPVTVTFDAGASNVLVNCTAS
jgi:hypothetical protein